MVGHGTACAGIIHALAPGADILSVRVLGPDNRGKGSVFAAGLEWAIEQGAHVVNLSLSSKSEALFGIFHDIVDQAYFANVLLVSAANNVPGPSYPSLFSSVISVAAHDVADPWRGSTTRSRRSSSVPTGSTSPSPGRTGPDRRDGQQLRRPAHGGDRDAHPGEAPPATPFEVKAILAATATGATPEP